MKVEFVTDLLMKKILMKMDPRCTGSFIEIGLGSGNFSFVWAQPLGFTCHAIEPLPTANLVEQHSIYKVGLTEAAITDVSGTAQIHIGSHNGNTWPDISSLHKDWWGGGTEEKTVSTLTLMDFLAREQIDAISCLKIDTEGSELSVIKGLQTIDPQQCPKIVVFEYGGGGGRAEKTGGWNQRFFDYTVECLSILKGLGYTKGLMIEQVSEQIQTIDLSNVVDLETLFSSEAEGGNVICTNQSFSDEDLRRIISSIRFQVISNNVYSLFSGAIYEFRNRLNRYSKGIIRRLNPSSLRHHE